MILDATTKSLEIDLAEAHTTSAMSVVVDYVDFTSSDTVAGSSDSATNGTTVVTILAAPAASTQRKVNAIFVHNADTVSHTATIQLNNSGTIRPIPKVTLAAGELGQYTDTAGWSIVNGNTAEAMASNIHAATNKTTPVDADEVGIWDSVSGLLNRLSWANIKATLKTYFDTLYVALTGNQSIAGIKTFTTQLIGKGTVTDDDAAAAYIGEYLENIVSTNQNFPASGVSGDGTSRTLDPGDYDAEFTGYYSPNGATVSQVFFGLGTVSGNDNTGVSTPATASFPALTNSPTSVSKIVRVKVATGTTKTIYLKVNATYSAGTPQYRCMLNVRRRR